jgi:S1-C subfamily serine protease
MRTRTLLAIAGILWAGTALAAGPYGSIHVGLWTGGAYTNDTTGAFSYCAASTGYNSGVTLVVGQSAAGGWLLGMGNPAWGNVAGQTFPIDITFDAQAQFHLFGSAFDSSGLVIATLPNNAIVEQFRKSNLLVVTMKGITLPFNLTSTGQLLPAIATCVTKVKAAGITNAGDFSVLPPKPSVPTTPAKSTATTSAPPPQGSKGAAGAAPKPPKLVDVNGTGFVVSTAGHIVTNNHVIDGCVGDVHGNLTGEGATTLRLVSRDETNDLALLQASKTLKDIATIRSTAIRSGDSIIAIGYPYHGLLTSDFTVSTGIVNSLSGLLNDTRYLQISAPIQPGNSGGPLLDTSGNVVGVVAAKINALKFAKATGDIPENINFAIKTGALRDFLDNSVVPYQTAEPSAELKTTQIASNARAYTMLVSCSAKEDMTAGK